MNRPRRQGTSWETELVRRAQDYGMMSDRLPEAGNNDRGDIWIINPPHDASNTSVALAWKRLVGNGNRRSSDGVRDGVFLTTEDFLNLVAAASILNPDIGWVIECKATERLNVTRALDNARRKAFNPGGIIPQGKSVVFEAGEEVLPQ